MHCYHLLRLPLLVPFFLSAPLVQGQELAPALQHTGPSPEGAIVLSTVTTAIPVAIGTAMMLGEEPGNGLMVAWAGLTLGPLSGYVYAGDLRAGLRSALLRGGGIGLMGLGSSFALFSRLDLCFHECPESSEDDTLFWIGVGMGIAGAGAALWGTVDGIAGAGRAARRTATRVRLGPGYDAASGTPLLHLQVRF